MSLDLLDGWVQMAKEQGASDLHLEPGMPPTLRVRGALKMVGERVTSAALQAAVRGLLVGERWNEFIQRHSFDMSKTMRGVRCRINIMRTARGLGMAIRLLATFQASLKKLNLHPDLAKLVEHNHGLVIISGATGAGKSSTLAALLHEVNNNSARHIITIESPIEYAIVPRKSLVRQREVGRDTPSFNQALVDALREDPDVLMVGEIREPEAMRLTLNAAETGHLVLTTLHSSTAAEALQRLVSAFAPEVQAGVCAQLADALVAVVCQRLSFRPQYNFSVPECEILLATTPVRSIIRQGGFNKLQTALETGGTDGNYTFARYRAWLDHRHDLYLPGATDSNDAPPDDFEAEPIAAPPPRAPRHTIVQEMPAKAETTQPEAPGVLVIDEDEADPAAIMAEMERRRR